MTAMSASLANPRRTRYEDLESTGETASSANIAPEADADGASAA